MREYKMAKKWPRALAAPVLLISSSGGCHCVIRNATFEVFVRLQVNAYVQPQ